MSIELRYLHTEEVPAALEALHLEKDAGEYQYLAAFDENHHVVGVTIIYANLSMDNMHIESLDVSEKARGHGVATAMLEVLYAQAGRAHKVVTTNGFTAKGQQHLVHVMNRLGQQHHVATTQIGRC
ncbi:MAG: GNAT family N-acetyltransferase [Rickettsiales bacterium]